MWEPGFKEGQAARRCWALIATAAAKVGRARPAGEAKPVRFCAMAPAGKKVMVCGARKAWLKCGVQGVVEVWSAAGGGDINVLEE